MRKKVPLLHIAAVVYLCCYAQLTMGQEKDSPQAGIKTNLLYDATTTFNLGVEFRLSNKTSLDVSGNWNPWTFGNDRKWKHLLAQPEFRLWTKETFSGHFFGIHSHYAYYNIGNLPKSPFSQNMKDHRYEGWLVGAGIGYGHRWNLSHRWGLEAEIGVGYAYMDYDKYKCGACGKKLGSDTKHYFGPTKAALSLVYSLGGKKTAPPPAPVPVYTPPVQKEEIIAPSVPRYTVSYVVPEEEVIKTRSEEGRAYLDFAMGKSAIVPSFGNNARELKKIYDLIEELKNDPDATMTGITITGYASPEGTYQSNLALSEKRAIALKNQIKAMYAFPETFFAAGGKGEDWATLDSLVAQSSITEKYRALEIIRSTGVFDGREKKLMDLAGGNPYRQMLSEMFPQLRRSEYRLIYTVPSFTIEKGKEIFRTKPSSLSLNEMFMIANTYEPGSDAFDEVFETAARIFPRDNTANINAGAAALERGDTVSAERYLLKVVARNGAYYNNMSILYALLGEYEKASDGFGRAVSLNDGEAAANSTLLRMYQEEMEAYEHKNNGYVPSETY